MFKSQMTVTIFEKSINDYHHRDLLEPPIENPYKKDSLEHLLYLKNWIDTIQWHYEDLIRDSDLDPSEALLLKRKIDTSNQKRTDLVEHIDSYFLKKYHQVKPLPKATINTESPAWAIDRLSILALKIYHMHEQTQRKDVNPRHISQCQEKLEILLEQKKDLCQAIDQLIEDIASGTKYMKVYKQMKMYNDESLNPVFYKNKK